MRTTKAQISLCVCVVWSRPSLLAIRITVECFEWRLICSDFPDVQGLRCHTCPFLTRYISIITCRTVRKRTCAPCEDSDQPAHWRRLIRIVTGRIFGYPRMHVFHADNGCASGFESSLGAHVRRYVFSTWSLSQQAHIKMTSYQRRYDVFLMYIDVITSHRRWYDVILMYKMTSYQRRCTKWRRINVDATSKWRRINVHTTWLRRIDVDTTSFWCGLLGIYLYVSHVSVMNFFDKPKVWCH